MNDQTVVRAALQCLRSIEKKPAGLRDISAQSGVALPECGRLLSRLHQAGLLELDREGHFGLLRPLDQLSVLEILDAVWETGFDPSERTLLFGIPMAAAEIAQGDPRLC